MTSGVDIVNIARTQIGFIAGPNESTPFSDWYGLPNEPYCAQFVSWCFNQAGASNLVAASTDKGFSYCPEGLTWFQKKGRVIDKYKGLPGDLVFFSWNGNGVADHVGIVEAASTDGITTIEGNTGPEHSNDPSQSGVFRRHRAYLYVLAIVRPEYPSSSAPQQGSSTGKKVAAGVAGAATVATGGTAVVHNAVTGTNTPIPVKPPTVIVAPPFPGTKVFKVGAKGKAEYIVAKALVNAGLLPATMLGDTLVEEDLILVPEYQKMYPGLNKSIGKGIDALTYESMAQKANE